MDNKGYLGSGLSPESPDLQEWKKIQLGLIYRTVPSTICRMGYFHNGRGSVKTLGRFCFGKLDLQKRLWREIYFVRSYTLSDVTRLYATRTGNVTRSPLELNTTMLRILVTHLGKTQANRKH